MENNKKILIPTIVAVATVVLLVFGATYAYFTVGSTNRFGTKELNATVEDIASAVVLEQVENTLSLNVTRAMMSEDNSGSAYYASGSVKPANIAKISVAGDGIYKCDYKVTISKSASSEENDLYYAIKENNAVGEISFSLNSNNIYLEDYQMGVYDFYDISFPMTYTDTIYNITKDSPKYITSNLEIDNGWWEQNYLKRKDITLTYSISDFECELSEPNEEYTELSFNIDFLDDIGYNGYFDLDGQYNFFDKNIVIPETFQGKNGVWYKVTSISDISHFPMENVENIEIPDSVTSIYGGAFLGFDGDTIKLPKKLESIGEGLFGIGGLKNIYLPKSLSNIDSGFLAETYLENIYYEGTEQEWNTLFEDYVGEDKEFESIIYYLYNVYSEEEFDEWGYTIPEFHFNVNY